MSDDNFWDGAEVIDAYTDDDAIADGQLVELKALGLGYKAIDKATSGVLGLYREEEYKTRLQELIDAAEAKIASSKNDYFYSIKHGGREFFVEQNETAYTILLPEEH